MVSDPASIQNLLRDPRNRPVANAFNELSSFANDSEAAGAIADYISILQKARDKSQESLAAARTVGATDYSFEKVLHQIGVSKDQWAKAIGNPDDLRAAGYTPARSMTIFDANVVAQRAANLQKGRSLAQAQRLMAEMASDASPKAEAPSMGGVVKSHQVPSSRQVQVLSKSHPLSLEMQRRRSLNLPLVSKKHR
jgi:hypothetical protein